MSHPTDWIRTLRARTTAVVVWDAMWVGVAAFGLLGLGASPARLGGAESALPLAAASAAITLLAASYCGLYRLPVLGRSGANLRRFSVVAGLLALTLWIGARWFAPAPLGISTSLLCGAAALVAMPTARITGTWIARVPALRHRVLFVGTGDVSDRLMAALDAAGIGIEVAGVLTRGDADIVGQRRVIGRVEDLSKVLRDSRIHRVVVAEPSADEPLPMDLLIAAKISGVPVESGLRLDEALNERVPLHELRPEDIVFEDGFAPGRSYGIVSRAIDIASGSVGLLLFGPLLLLAMLAIRIESPGSPIYWQPRIGRGGRIFSVCKLRSMRDDAEATTGAVFASGTDDDRVTKVGRVLRKTRIDELPQLWNVLKGEMSLVGPRPERSEFIDELRETYPHFSLRHAVRPGITGLAQIRLGYVYDLEGWGPKLAYDLYYVKHRSLRLDLDIVLGTTRTVLLMRGV